MKRIIVILLLVLAAIPCFASYSIEDHDGYITYIDEDIFILIPTDLKIPDIIPIEKTDKKTTITFVNNDYSESKGNVEIVVKLTVEDSDTDIEFNDDNLDTYDLRTLLYDNGLRDSVYVECKKINGNIFIFQSSYGDDGSFEITATYAGKGKTINAGAILANGWDARLLNTFDDLLSMSVLL